MFFKYDKKISLLDIGDTFATLVEMTPTGDAVFKFEYRINQSDAVKNDALAVKVSVSSKVPLKNEVTQQSNVGDASNKDVVKNVLSIFKDAKAVSKQQESLVVASKKSDVTAKINNSVLPQLKLKLPSNIPSLKSTSLTAVPISTLQKKNEEKPLLQFVALSSVFENEMQQISSSVALKLQPAMMKMINLQGTDPSNITKLTHRSMPAINSLAGFPIKIKQQEPPDKVAPKVLNSMLFNVIKNPIKKLTSDLDSNEYASVDVVELKDKIVVPVIVTVPYHRMLSNPNFTGNYIVKFELLDVKTNAVIDQVIKQLDVTKHTQIFNTPTLPPIVNVTKSDFASKVTLEIKQVDTKAIAIALYKRVIPQASVDLESYVLVGQYELTSKQQSLLVPVDLPTHSSILYRVIPVSVDGNLSAEFTNVVVSPQIVQRIKSIALNVQNTVVGTDIEVRNFPFDCAAITVMRKNLTIHQREYEAIGEPVLITDDVKTAGYINVTDTGVFDGWIYEYVARLTYTSGDVKIAGNFVIEHVKQQPGRVALEISDVEVSHNSTGPNVTFRMNSDLIDQDIDVLKKLLLKQGNLDYFQDDIKKEREFLKSLLAYHIVRIDITRGIHEDFGVLSDEIFDDKQFAANNSVEDLAYGHRYRYEINVLVRDPETMLEKFVKTSTDQSTKKPYEFKPSKFLHPVTLKSGTIMSKTGLQSKLGKNEMLYGDVGVKEIVEISFDSKNTVKINEALATRFDDDTNLLSWTVNGEIDDVDHFIILKDVHGVRTVVGKSHSKFEFGNCQFVHNLQDQDKGVLQYVIIPILKTYEVLQEAVTNKVSV